MLSTCLFTAIILIVPATPGLERYLPDRWWIDEEPVLAGDCRTLVDGGHVPVRINSQHQLTIIFSATRFIIPLPPKPGRWPMRYVLGEERADMGVWGKVYVRRGPKDPL